MSNNYIIVDGELYHYGVKGMKWGKRKQQKYVYKSDKRIRRDLEADAYESGQINKQYQNRLRKDTKKLNKMLTKDPNKISEKTRTKINTVSQLKVDASATSRANKQSLEKLQKHVDTMKKNSPDKKIKDVKVKIKNGETYLNSKKQNWDNANVNYYLSRSKVAIKNGKEYMDVYMPQKLKTYYYVY